MERAMYPGIGKQTQRLCYMQPDKIIKDLDTHGSRVSPQAKWRGPNRTWPVICSWVCFPTLSIQMNSLSRPSYSALFLFHGLNFPKGKLNQQENLDVNILKTIVFFLKIHCSNAI